MTSYICVVPFKELGLGLSEEQVSEEEAHNLTDGFSLPALKVISPRRTGTSTMAQHDFLFLVVMRPFGLCILACSNTVN